MGIVIGNFRFIVICNEVGPFYLSMGSSLLQTVSTSLWPKENFLLHLRHLVWLAMLDSLAFGKMVVQGVLFECSPEDCLPLIICYWMGLLAAL